MTSSHLSNEEIKKCPNCNNTYWIINEKGNAVRCKCFEIEKMNRRLRFANLPPAFSEMTLKTFKSSVYQQQDSKNKISVIVSAVKTYMENFDEMQAEGKGLYLYSHTKGSGKTRLIASIANELIKEHQVKFATSISILNEIKKTYDKESKDNESKLMEDLSNTEILIIDDFGVEKAKDFNNQRFYHLINERYINKKVTFYTSNHSLNELEYDERITNRIKEQAFQLQFPEESVRELIAKQNSKMLVDKVMQGGAV